MKRIYCLLALLSLAGCANQPVGKPYAISAQKKVAAVHHWGLIAGDAAEQTRLAIQGRDFAGRPLYVMENTGTHFDRAFRNYMITSLVNAGLQVSTVKEGAIEISYETQVVRHGASFDPGSFGYKPGFATVGVTGYWILRNASSGLLAASTIAGAAGYDVYKATEPTGVELLITTSIVHGNQYVMRNTDAYYIEKADAYLFEPCRSKSLRGCKPRIFD